MTSSFSDHLDQASDGAFRSVMKSPIAWLVRTTMHNLIRQECSCRCVRSPKDPTIAYREFEDGSKSLHANTCTFPLDARLIGRLVWRVLIPEAHESLVRPDRTRTANAVARIKVIHRCFVAVCRHTKGITHVVQLPQSFGYLANQRKSRG